MDRRNFIKGAMYFTVASASTTLIACGGGSGGALSVGQGGTFRFSHGVASGDPKANSVVFWTRCVRGAAGDNSDIGLRLEVSPTADFAALVASVNVVASAEYDNTVRAKITNLSANTRYFYRFVAGFDVSPVGQTKTAPAASTTPAEIRFGWFTCQDWSINHWAAMELLVNENIDFLIHLGDYVYETVGAGFQTGAAEPAHTKIVLPDGKTLPGGGTYANTVADYRTLYRTYRGDPRLQELHRKFPIISIWDDHEFSDDCWKDHQTYTNENKQETSRRRNASQAWAEYMPVDFGDVSFSLNAGGYDNIRIYRDFQFGTLMHLVMTDERLYRDDHNVSEATYARLIGSNPVDGSDSVGSRYFVPQPVLTAFEAENTTALDRTPSILGTTQTDWWKSTLKGSTATWKVWGNEVTMTRQWADLRQSAPSPYNQLFVVNADCWDGFPKHRNELMGFVKDQGIKNLMMVTGDLHAFQVGVIRDTQLTTGTPVAVDFVAAGISSSSAYSYFKAGAGTTPLAQLVASPAIWNGFLRANNPDFAYLDQDAQGYAVASVTAAAFTVWFSKMKPLNADGTKPASPLLKRTQITVAVGTNTPVVQDNV
jgi:alkaline phosphatase D